MRLAAGVLISLAIGGVHARAAGPDVFIGGVGPLFCTNIAAVAALPALGLYEHANGIAACSPPQRAAIWQAWGARPRVAEIGGVTEAEDASLAHAQYLSYFGGTLPGQVNMNIITGSGDGSGTYTAAPGAAKPGAAYAGRVTPADLATMQSAIREARKHGARSVAIFQTPNGGHEDLDDPFAASAFWANARAAALYGGGLALDTPPNYFFARGAPYQAFVAQMIRWGVAKGLRVSLIVSPYALKPDASGNAAGCGYDPGFMDATLRMATQLRAVGAKPTQWVVENYGLPGPHCGTANDVQTGAAPESLNAMALYLAHSGDRAGTAP